MMTMRKKILTFVTITIIFSLISATTLFIIITNMKEVGITKELLENLNNYVSSSEITDIKYIENYKINGVNVRCSVINKNGEVVYDTYGRDLGNHLDRPEIKECLDNGSGYDIRISSVTGEKNLYYASQLKDGTILRTAIPYKKVGLFNSNTILYWIIILGMVVVVSLIFSMKLIKTIVDPLKELEDVTSRIANGDLHIRVKPSCTGEIHSLGETFNNMADQLQSQINQVLDKQNRLESILSCMESGVIAVNRKNKVIIINPYAKRIFGIRNDITGENISDYIIDYDINSFLSSEDVMEEEIKLYYPLERELRIKKSSIIYDLEKIGKVITVQDITDIKRLENMRSQFVANVSHELKTPITSIKGFAETLKYVEDDETRTKFLDIIDKESDRLTRLITDILVLSKIESESIGDEEEFLPNMVIEDVLNMVKSVANSKNITIEVEEENCELLYGDKDRFLQVVLNLVENSIKYSDEGAKVKIKSYSRDENYIIEVSDNGYGIPKEDLPRIFERFYRVDKSRKGNGTGLGLAIVKHIVKNFNGTIDIDSELGKGSTFTIKIKHI